MTALKLYEIWVKNGTPESLLKKQLLTIGIFGEIFKGKYYAGKGDHELYTTPELVARSADFELFQETFVAPPETCTSCHGNGKDWTYGHRPNWSVCSQCETVFPCHCHRPDRNGNGKWYELPDENGKCSNCGRTLTELGLARIREAEALEEAELQKWWRVVAEQKEQARVRQLGEPCDSHDPVVVSSLAEVKTYFASRPAELEATSEPSAPGDMA
jgi:hypothetical protein